MQVTYLLEQRLEDLVIDRQEWPTLVATGPRLVDRRSVRAEPIAGMVGADSDRDRHRRSRPPALGSAPSALPRLETSLALAAGTSSKVSMNPLLRADSD